MRLGLSVLVLLAGLSSAAAASDGDLKTAIVGKWANTKECATGGYMQFNQDGTFVQAAPAGAPPNSDLAGTFDIQNGELSGSAKGQAMGPVALSFDEDHLILKDATGADQMVRCQ